MKRQWRKRNNDRIYLKIAQRKKDDPDFRAKLNATNRRTKLRKRERMNNDMAYRSAESEKIRIYNKHWRSKNPDYHTQYFMNRKKKDPAFKIRCDLASRISLALRGSRKSSKTVDLLGCSIQNFILFIESKWISGMTWNNYGNRNGDWSVDHVKPCAAYSDLANEDQQRQCFHYSNLRPCWHLENVSKGSLWGGKRWDYGGQLSIARQ